MEDVKKTPPPTHSIYMSFTKGKEAILNNNSPRLWSVAVSARMSELQGQSHCKLVSLTYCSQTSNQLRVGVHGSPGRQAELQEERKPIQLSSWWSWCSQNIVLYRQLRHHLEKLHIIFKYYFIHYIGNFPFQNSSG